MAKRKLFLVTYIGLSDSEPDANGYCETFLYVNHFEALAKMNSLAENEMQEHDSDLSVKTEDNKRVLSWAGGTESVIITVKEIEVEREDVYTYKEMENAVHLSVDLFEKMSEAQEIKQYWADGRERSGFMIGAAKDLETRLSGQDEEKGNYDYYDELEKYENELLQKLENDEVPIF